MSAMAGACMSRNVREEQGKESINTCTECAGQSIKIKTKEVPK